MSGVLAALGGGLQTALLLARGRPDGLVRLVAPPADPVRVAARSFWALPLCLPAFLLLDLWGTPDGRDVGPWVLTTLGFDTLGYLVGWVGFAVLSWEVIGRIGRGGLWWRFIAAWNWSNVAQHGLFLVAGGLAQVSGPDVLAQAAWVVAAGWALWIEWYAVRLTLGLAPIAAGCIVALDIAVGLLASGLADSLNPSDVIAAAFVVLGQ